MMDEQTENEAADQVRAWALNLPVPNPDDIEVDKIPGAWVVTYWLPDGVTLRLKIEHVNRIDPIDVVFQVRHKGALEFESLGKCMAAPFVFEDSVGFEDILQQDVDALPNPWKLEFATMLKTWSRLTGIVEFGSTHEARYGREPESSVDCYTLEESSGKPA